MALSFELNNSDFNQVSFPNSILYALASNSLSDDVRLSSKHLPISTNELFLMVSGVLHGKFFS